MVYQAHAVEADQSEDVPLRSVARNTSEFAEDILMLGELQAKLLVLEAREWSQSQLRPVGLAVAGGLFALGLIPIAFLALAAAIVETTALSPAQSLGLSFLFGAAIAAALLAGAYSEWKFKKAYFARTIHEWDANLRWLRNMVRRQGRRW